jgi:hypothetical protein
VPAVTDDTTGRQERRCRCCHRPWEALPVPPTPVCADCVTHRASSLAAERAHVRLWQEYAERLQAWTARRPEDGPTGEISQAGAAQAHARGGPHVAADVLEEERDKTARAFRSRDMAYRALSEVRLLHHETEAGRCRCGLPVQRCAVAMVVDRYPALASWEAKQLKRVRKGQPHMLPRDHPGLPRTADASR